MGWVLVRSLAWRPGLRPASRWRLNSIVHRAGWIITPCHGKECFPPSAALVSSVLGNGDSYLRLHCYGTCLQHLHSSPGPRLAFCDAGWDRDRDRHWHRSEGQSLYRILRGQPSRAAAWGIRHRTLTLRFCFAVIAVLAGAV